MQGIVKRYLLTTLALLIFLVVAGFTFAEKNVVLSADGKTWHVKTKAHDVTGFLREQKVTYKDRDFVFPPPPSRVEEGTHIIVKHATPVIINLDRKEKKVFTLAATVRGAIEEAGIQFRAADKIDPGPDVRITKNLQIRITRATSSLDANRVPIPYQTITQKDSSLLQGRAVVVQEGKEGLAIQIFEVKNLEGQEVEQKLRTERLICAPVDKIIKIGTKKAKRAKPVRVAAVPARTNVSRGGDGRTVVMEATAYSPGHGCGYSTATGRKAEYGVVAVDPRVIPLGTKVYVEGYGEAIAADTGGAIKGNRIDLCYNSESQCVAFGRQNVVVHVQE